MRIISMALALAFPVASLSECRIVGQTVRCSLAEYQALLSSQQRADQAVAEVNRCAQHTQALAAQVNQCASQKPQGSGMPSMMAGMAMLAAVPFIPVFGLVGVGAAGAIGYGAGKESDRSGR
jgi:hypothetical protein